MAWEGGVQRGRRTSMQNPTHTEVGEKRLSTCSTAPTCSAVV